MQLAPFLLTKDLLKFAYLTQRLTGLPATRCNFGSCGILEGLLEEKSEKHSGLIIPTEDTLASRAVEPGNIHPRFPYIFQRSVGINQ